MSFNPLTVWYQNGLKFRCTECGKCCTGTPGVVWITEEEIIALAAFLQLSIEDVHKRYIRKCGNRLALIEKPPKQGEYDCIFLKGKRCTIYPVRPKQCRTFPWWDENLTSKEAWQEAGKLCEGIDHPDSPLISLQEIIDQKQ